MYAYLNEDKTYTEILFRSYIGKFNCLQTSLLGLERETGDLHYKCACIIESVDSISRDGPDCPYMKYITKTKISQSTYRFKSSNCHYRNLRVEYYQYT